MTKKKYAIRNAGFADVSAMFDIIRQHMTELLPRAVSDIIQNIDRFLVGEADGKVVGLVSWQILPDIALAKDPTVEIKSLAVKKDYRGKGIGKMLVKAAIKRVSVLRPSQIIVLTFHPDFFRKFGFHEVPKKDMMHKLYMGCLNCTKYDSPFTCPEVAMSLVLDHKR